MKLWLNLMQCYIVFSIAVKQVYVCVQKRFMQHMTTALVD